MKKLIPALPFILGILVAPLAVRGQDVLIKNATLLTITRGTIASGDLLILGGIIREVGVNLIAPKGVKVIDATGKYVLPGLIDSHTHIGVMGVNETGDIDTAEVSVRDVLYGEDVRLYYALAGGVTMIHTMHGSANPIGGRNLTLKLKWGEPSEAMIVPEALPTLKFALGENPKKSYSTTYTSQHYPKTRMGVKAVIRREFEKAKNYMEQWERYEALKKTVKKGQQPPLPPREDLRMETLAAMLKGQLYARCHTYRADETLEFLQLSKELGFKIACLDHASEAFKIARELAEAGVGISVFMDTWSYKYETAEGIAMNAATCARQGVLVSLNSDSGPQMQYLFNDAAKAMRYGGLSEEEALKLVTINPAVQLGVNRVVGSLEVGKHGDVAVFNRHPLSAYTRCEMTLIEGKVYFDRAQDLKEREAREKKKPSEGAGDKGEGR